MNLKLASLSFEIALNAEGKVPTDIRIMPAGQFQAVDGRPREVPSRAWLITEVLAQSIIAKLKAKSDDTLIDYNHGSLEEDPEPEQAIAAGWFHDADYRADGLYATAVKWTPRAEQFILNKEYRYLSPVFYYNPDNGEVTEIDSVALTNTPALDGLDDLIAALSRKHTQDEMMPTDSEQIAALTVERDTEKAKVAQLTVERDEAKQAVAALTTERDELKTKVAALEVEKEQIAANTEKQKCADLIAAALTSGKVLPHAKPYLETKTTVADLTLAIDAFGGNGLTQALLSRQHQKEEPEADSNDAQAIADKATAYQLQQAALGREVDDVTAIAHVTKGVK